MKKTIILIIGLFVCSSTTNAQSGKTFGKVFSNFNYDMSTEEAEDGFKAFEIKRSYLGYAYTYNNEFSAKITFDVGSNDGGSAYTAFLKIASLTWNASDNMKINFGMIGTKNFKFMEKAWGKRYIYKSLLDQQKWASSADAGASVDYQLSDNLYIDMQILNGDGYKNTQGANGMMRGGGGVTYKMGALAIRASVDMVPRTSYAEDNEMQTINTVAAAYDMGMLNVGGEYNIMENTSFILDNSKTGLSLYGDFKLNDSYSVFGRYDKLSSEDANGNQWNLSNDGEFTIFGIQRKMTKGVTAALNIQTWKDATQGAEQIEGESTLYLNLEYKF